LPVLSFCGNSSALGRKVAERLKTGIPCGGPQTKKKNDGKNGTAKIQPVGFFPYMYRVRVFL
jgi:hypothetical protein